MLVETLFNATLVGAEWVLYLLVALSMASIAVTAERSILFASNRVDFKQLGQKLKATLEKNDLESALGLLRSSKSPEARICLSGLEQVQKGLGSVEESIAAAVNIEKTNLEKHLAFLGTVGSNAPFIGLFGTVLGIIRAFHDLSSGSQEGASAVMSGISEALVATAVGLLVAIPAVVAFNIFKRKAAARMTNADTLTHVLYAYLKS